MKILVFNCGSSSIKFKLFHMPDENVLAEGLVERVGSKDAFASLKTPQGKTETNLSIVDYPSGFSVIKSMLLNPEHGAIKSLSEVNACGHRVVHGGESFGGSMPIDDELETGIEAVFELAPLHNPPNLTGIQQARLIFGDIPQVACFDTAFHHSIPERAYRYALPEKLYTEYKVRRYGFHGMSHQFVARQAAQMLGMHKYSVNLITCHLGNGSSVAAIRDGHSVDTSMGLTPLEGLVMGTRSGDLDPGILFYLCRKGYDTDSLDTLLNKQSGLLGISGSSNDVRDLELKADGGDERAELALDIFAYRIKKYIGAYMAVLNRVDAIVFTGGIGENGAAMRNRILSNMDQQGIIIDEMRNSVHAGVPGEIQAQTSRIKVMIIPTNEELAIARDTFKLTKN
ncbi:MAG: acetate kinase [Candidatus Marinimicrobia bacterium]|jgi:acetate kinase|nr:acetate kinase [Candidatus Neomarinimicrobiota bacterium]MBT3632152.1 acetate kinase [Candidatus Neomarinimicrobiota bacterium]MBT3824282.1 acetate kinase [Candidatus Neomarinimicrobiota bacterium]MBT4129103.1 acetate kinase [Candidatus Neomarinimicrobiota bacterium]MBT4295656.1 acetate kinase [Candidatus Neomarinimicrobiota bacterium]